MPAPSQLVPAQTANTPSSQNMGVPAAPTLPVPGGSVVAGSGAGGNALPGSVSTTPYYITPGGGISMTPTPGSTPVVPAGYTGAATVGTGGPNMTLMLSLGAGLLALAFLLPKEGKGKRR